MNKKLSIALSAVGVLAIVIVGVVAQGRFFKGDFSPPMSVVCTKPLSGPVSGTRGRDGDDRRMPVSAFRNPCQALSRDEKTINKYIPPQVPVERSDIYSKVRAPAAVEKVQMNVKVRGK